MRLAADAPVLDGLAGTLDRMADAHDELTWQLGAWFVEVPASVWGARVRAGLGLRDLAVRVRAAAAAYRRADDLVRESLARVLDLAARGGLLSEWPHACCHGRPCDRRSPRVDGRAAHRDRGAG